MDRHYLTNIEGENVYHPKCVSFVALIDKLSRNELMVLECEEHELVLLTRLEVNKELKIKNLKIKRVI